MVDNRYNRTRYTGTSGVSCNSCKNSKSAMEKLRAIDFAIVDTVLYLDAYPECRSAIEHYNMLIKEREALAEMVNKTCGPLTIYDNQNNNKWMWVKGPWPWEPEAN